MLEPVGTAPGLVVPPRAQGGPVVLVLPGPPGELQAMWEPALATPLLSAIAGAAGPYEQRMLRLLGVPEPAIAATLRELEAEGMPLDRLEITTCLRRGELEIATVFAPPAAADVRGVRRARSASATARGCSPRTAPRSTTRSARLLGEPASRWRSPSPARAA